MAKFKNAMEIFKMLDKSNCRKCNETTCLAFAAAVFQGRRQLSECPQLDRSVLEENDKAVDGGIKIDEDLDKAMARLQEKVKSVDFSAAAERLGGVYTDDKLTIKILGKDLSIDSNGQFYTDLHIHSWLAGPVLNYVLYGEGKPVSGNWVPIRELEEGKSWASFFSQRCEKPIKRVADIYTDFFEDMIHLFAGSQVEQVFDSDISVILRVFPKVPILLCYWRPEEGMESDMHLFFDDTVESNLNIGSIYALGAGLALMFEKLAQRHG